MPTISLVSPAWKVRVWTEDSRVEIYWFLRASDVMESIRQTWSQKPDSIEVMEFPNRILVRERGLTPEDSGELLLQADWVMGFSVLDGPTHF